MVNPACGKSFWAVKIQEYKGYMDCPVEGLSEIPKRMFYDGMYRSWMYFESIPKETMESIKLYWGL